MIDIVECELVFKVSWTFLRWQEEWYSERALEEVEKGEEGQQYRDDGELPSRSLPHVAGVEGK